MKIVVAGEIIEQVKEFCYLGSMISDDVTEKSREGQQQRRQSGLKSGGSWIRVKEFDFYRQIFENFQFFQAILQKNIEFFRQLKKSIFQAKNCPFRDIPLGKLFYFSSKVTTFEHTSLRCNNISRPVHDSNVPPCDPPSKNLGVATLSPQHLRPWIAMEKKPFPGGKNYQGED